MPAPVAELISPDFSADQRYANVFLHPVCSRGSAARGLRCRWMFAASLQLV